jgi:methylation protein EvaC
MEIKTRKTCRLCKSKNLKQVIDFGFLPLAGGFLKEKDIRFEKKYPLRIFFCKDCGLVQIIDVISQKTLFKDYRYTSSTTKTLSGHFEEYAKEMSGRFLKKDDFVLEIGSNDGVLLAPLKKNGIRAVGIDPASNIVFIARSRGLEVVNDFFNRKTAGKILKKYGKARAIFSNNTLAHIDDMDEIMGGVKSLLAQDGVLVFEVQYLADLIRRLQYDFFYHEHLCYYSLKPLMKFLDGYEMEVFDVKKIPIHGGSLRVYAKNKGVKKYPVSKKIAEILREEKNMGLYEFTGLLRFAEKIKKHRDSLVSVLDKIKSQGASICAYGASGRSVTLTNYCGIGKNYLEYIVDASPERFGRIMPGTHVKIVSPDYFKNNPADVLLITAWTYEKEIMAKEKWFLKRGKIIIPLPRIKVLGK